MHTLLVIDDDRSTRHLLRNAFRGEEFVVQTASASAEGLRMASEISPDVILLDLVLPETSGLDVARSILRENPATPVVFITAYGSSDTAIEAMKVGAFDYLAKPLDLRRVREVVARALKIREEAPRDAAAEPDPLQPFESVSLIGRSPPMQDVFKAIGRVAAQDVTVLILGESGTGKELVARAIHQHGHRAEHCLLAVNCAAMPEALLESELFGHEQGAFTGANERRIGKFELCSGGTIFLDEIGDMSPAVQSKILRLLQDQQFQRVGGTDLIRTDVRILAATNRDLRRMVAEGTFREDLYYRIDGFTIHIPPLRERGEDLPLLVQWYLRQICHELGRPLAMLSAEARDAIESYSWPGNVRELEAVLRQTLLQTAGPVILSEFLPEALHRSGGTGGEPTSDLAPFVDERLRQHSEHLYLEAMIMMERYVLTRVLRETQGNRSHAARVLGITRGCLRNRLRSLKILVDTRIDDGQNVALAGSREQPVPAGRHGV